MRIRDVLIDAWSWLNYWTERRIRITQVARSPGSPSRGRRTRICATAAYKTATAYYRNHAGHLGAAATGNEDAWGCRELGDPVKLIDAMVGCLLGAEQTVIVPGTEHAQDDDAASEAKAAAEARQRLEEWADKELLALRMQR